MSETLPVRKDDPLPLNEGWSMILYCRYSDGVSHDMETHGVEFAGATKHHAWLDARAAGWMIHRDRTASCPRCVRKLELR